ncbi:hypothetical protein BDW59DRAFT_171776 [Aspergillus cavernicola]|uniref:Uncharacterized protein n=1 Tax=Aspergillus cavernicola TaxID=176166 RepID=A0ABR4IG17_9EURO
MYAAIKQHDREAEQTMREERDRYTKMIKKVENDTGTLRLTMNNLLAERDRRVARMEQQMKEQQAAHKAELERFIISPGFARVYSHLAAYLDYRGLNNLVLCSLGPGGTYYARWRDGRWMSWASEEINEAISEAQSNTRHVKAIALGSGGSYIISFGSSSG